MPSPAPVGALATLRGALQKRFPSWAAAGSSRPAAEVAEETDLLLGAAAPAKRHAAATPAAAEPAVAEPAAAEPAAAAGWHCAIAAGPSCGWSCAAAVVALVAVSLFANARWPPAEARPPPTAARSQPLLLPTTTATATTTTTTTLAQGGTAAGEGAAADGAGGPRGSGVVVLLAGTLVRYFPNLDRHVVAPLTRQGHAVDVYLSLSVESFTSWKGHANLFVMHPAYEGKSLEEVRAMIVGGIRDNGGRVGIVRMPTQVHLTLEGLSFEENGTWWTSVDSDDEQNSHARTTRANVAKMYQEIDELWALAKEAEARAGESYEYLMIFRDDSNWLFDFDLGRLLRTGGQVVLDGGAGRAFGQKCGSQGTPRLCDYVVVAERKVAEPFGSFYRLITDPASMGVSLDPSSETVTEGERYVYQVVQAFGIRFEQVPPALIPFERCGRLDVNGSTTVCLHKDTYNEENAGDDGVPSMGVHVLIPVTCSELAAWE